MQLRQIEVFHAVMISGSTVGASEYLNVTQPAISTTLKRLQDELKIRLFSNVKGRLVPTPEAHILFRQVRAIHDDIAQLQRLTEALSAGRIGFIRLGVVPALGDTIAADAISHMRVEDNDLSIAVEVLNTHELIHRLQAGRLDFACVFGALDHMPLEIIKRYRVDIVCVGPADWLSDKQSISLDELTEFPLALMRPTDPIGHMLEIKSRELGTHLASTIELRNCRAAIALARNGVAVGVSDTFSLGETLLGSAVALPFDPPLSIELSIAIKKDQVQPIATQRFIEEIAGSIERALTYNTGRLS